MSEGDGLVADGFEVDIAELRDVSRFVNTTGERVGGLSPDGLAAGIVAAMPGSGAASVASEVEAVHRSWLRGWSRDLSRHAGALAESAKTYVEHDERSAAAFRTLSTAAGSSAPSGGNHTSDSGSIERRHGSGVAPSGSEKPW